VFYLITVCDTDDPAFPTMEDVIVETYPVLAWVIRTGANWAEPVSFTGDTFPDGNRAHVWHVTPDGKWAGDFSFGLCASLAEAKQMTLAFTIQVMGHKRRAP
jgi:hypothetical protein